MPNISSASLGSRIGGGLRAIQNCVSHFSAVGKIDSTIAPGSPLDKLSQSLAKKRQRELADMQQGDPLPPETKFRSKNGVAKVELGYLHVEKDAAVIRALAVAVKEGRVSEIDAGRVVGGKALNYLLRLASMAPAEKPVFFKGDVRMYVIMRGKAYDIKSGRTGVRNWTENDEQVFEETLQRMKIRNACMNIWDGATLETCGSMRFNFDSNNPDDIRWSD